MTRMLTNSNLLLAIAVPLVLLNVAPGTGVRTDSEIRAILSNVDSSRILNTALTLQSFRTLNLAQTNLSRGTASPLRATSSSTSTARFPDSRSGLTLSCIQPVRPRQHST
jgi:hypothetical protein